MEITKGKWEVSQRLQVQANVDEPLNTSTICQVFGKEEDHAILIADAGNTYQATNKLPSELAEANKELLEALKKALTVLVKAEYTDGYDATIEAELVETLHKDTNNA